MEAIPGAAVFLDNRLKKTAMEKTTAVLKIVFLEFMLQVLW